MIVTGHQPNYVPYPGFFHKIMRADAFVIVDTTQFVKRGPFGWIHRNRIRTSSERGWDWLTIPVLTRGKYHQAICDTRINNAVPWARKHLRAIELNYGRSGYFDRYFPYLEDVFARSWENLSELTEELIRYFLGELSFTGEVKRTTELNVHGKATGLIIDICKALDADTYISGIHGRDYIDASLFDRTGISLVFQDYSPTEYPQQHNGAFVPDLSILDMLMNCGPDETRDLLSGGLAG